MTTPTRVLSPALAALAIAVAGCGGGGGGGGQTLSKSEFQSKANAICKQFNADIAKLGAPSNFSEVPAFTDKAIALSDAALDKLNDLKPPKEFQDDWSQWLDYGSQLHDTADELKTAAKNKDAKALQAAGVKADARDKKSDAIATRLGLPTCAKG
jgi:hypothetical protein